jgi:hypothetical protein
MIMRVVVCCCQFVCDSRARGIADDTIDTHSWLTSSECFALRSAIFKESCVEEGASAGRGRGEKEEKILHMCGACDVIGHAPKSVLSPTIT